MDELTYVFAVNEWQAMDYARKYNIPTNKIKRISDAYLLRGLSLNTEIHFIDGAQTRADYGQFMEIAATRNLKVRYVS